MLSENWFGPNLIMSRRNKLDGCMFCGTSPCLCPENQPKKKPVGRGRKKGPPKEGAVVATDSHAEAVTPSFDYKAAMKRDTISQMDSEMMEAIAVLEPILHPEEIALVKPQLDAHKSPAQRWKERKNARQ